jgi:quinol monooxygenase YgiN
VNTATVVFINRLQPADGKRDALIGLLREFADSINADPECLPYSVHEPIDDEATRLTVIQAHTSVAGSEKHGEWMAPNIPRLVPLLASSPDPPVLLRSVSLGGDPKESFSARSRVLLRAPTASPGPARLAAWSGRRGAPGGARSRQRFNEVFEASSSA